MKREPHTIALSRRGRDIGAGLWNVWAGRFCQGIRGQKGRKGCKSKDKEQDDGLMARTCKRIKDGKGEAVGGDVRIVDEEEIAPVLE